MPVPDLAYLKILMDVMVPLFLNSGGSRLHVGPMSSNHISINEIPGSRLLLRPLLASLRTAAPHNEIPTSVALVRLTRSSLIWKFNATPHAQITGRR